jgi:prepilin-type N-terminal cleavage/methylation domain-containing protein
MRSVSGWLSRARRKASDEHGYTLLEMIIATAVLGLAVTVLGSVLISVQTSVGQETDRSINNDQAKLAVEQLDREIRSGNILYDPLLEDPNGHRLRVYTQSNGIPFRCVEWRITQGQLIRRERTPGFGLPWPNQWRVVAQDVINVDRSVKAFHLDPDPSKGSRVLDVTIVVNSDPSHPASDVTVAGAITGRNTSYGYPLAVCDPKPP